MQTRKNSALGFLFLIVIVIALIYYFNEDGGSSQPPADNKSGLPVLSKTVFIDLKGINNGKEVEFKTILNNDKTGSIACLGADANNTGEYGKWEVQLKNNDMMKINLSTNRGNYLVSLYKNKEASLTVNPYQLLGKWYQ